METTTETNLPTAEEMKAQKAKEKKIEKASKEIEKVLKKHNLGLQAFMLMTEFGIVPRVRLAESTEPTE